MKIAIVTFVRAYNYGAVLQCFALQKCLRNLGVDAEVLDYYPRYFFAEYYMTNLGQLRYLPYRPLKKWAKNTITLQIVNKRNQKFEKFIQENIIMSDRQYTDIEQLSKAYLPYDVYISGSDQVWNAYINRFDPVFFLDFHNPKVYKKMSYSASFGFDAIPVELRERYKRWLSGWVNYSVRESSGKSIIKELLGENACICCDPTLLLDKDDWSTFCQRKCKNEPYVLAYYANTRDKMPLEEAEKIASERNARLLCMTSVLQFQDIIGKRARAAGGKMLGIASPGDFVSNIFNADCVVTDSYHGMIFSLLFHKKVFLKYINSSGEPNVRMKELIKRLELNCSFERNGFFDICKDIDWDKVDCLMTKYRKESTDYLFNLMHNDK